MKVKVLNAQTQLEIREIDLPETMAQHGECSFGRSPNSALVLDSPDVSRLHGKFRLEQGQYYFYDLGSANGSMINGKLAQANHGYALKSGDVIRVGEFVLLLHEISLEDLPATVIGDPDATVIGQFQPIAIAPPVQEVQSPPIAVSEAQNIVAVADSVPVEVPPAIVNESAPILAETPEKELSEDIAESPQLPLEPINPPVIEQEPETSPVDIAQTEHELAAEPVLTEAATYLQLADSTTIQMPEDMSTEDAIAANTPELTKSPDSVTETINTEPADSIPIETVSESTGNVIVPEASEPTESVDLVTEEIKAEPSVIDSIPIETVSESTGNAIAADTPELTESADLVTEPIHLEPNVVDSISTETVDEPTENAIVLEASEPIESVDLITEAIVVESDVADLVSIETVDESTENAIAAKTSEPTESTNLVTEEIKAEPSVVDSIPIETVSEPTENAIATETPALDELSSSEPVEELTEEPLDPWDDPLPVAEPRIEEDATVLQVSEPLDQSETIEEVPADQTVLQISEPLEQSEDLLTEPVSEDSTVIQVSEPLEQLIPVIDTTPEVEPAIAELVPDEVEPPIDQPVIEESTTSEPELETPAVEKLTIITTKYIALLANDSQIEELKQLADRYQDLLKQCKTIATPTVSEALHQALGVPVSQQTPAVSSGGYQMINSLITSDQVIAVIFLRDFLAPQPTQANDDALSRSCNVYRVLFATNTPTADALLHYIQTVVATR